MFLLIKNKLSKRKKPGKHFNIKLFLIYVPQPLQRNYEMVTITMSECLLHKDNASSVGKTLNFGVNLGRYYVIEKQQQQQLIPTTPSIALFLYNPLSCTRTILLPIYVFSFIIFNVKMNLHKFHFN